MVDCAAVVGVGVDSRDAERGTSRVNRALRTTQKEVTRTGRVFKGLGATTQVVFAGFQKARSAILSVKGALVGLGVGIFGASVIRELDQFTFALSKLSAITGAVGEDLDFLRERALELGRTTIFSGQQVLEGFALMASAKPDLLENAEALGEVTEQALTLAAAASTDLPNAANILGASLNQFQAGADQAERFINVLAAGSKFGASFILDTAAALKQAGTAASLADISFEEINASIQVLATQNIKAAEAGTALRNMIIRLQTGADEFNPAIVGLQKALENLGAANLSVTERVKLFGVENINAADILIQGASAVGEFTEKLTGTNVAAEQAATNYDNLRGDILALQSAWSGFLIDIGTEQESVFRAAVQWVTEFINNLNVNLKIGATFFSLFFTDIKRGWSFLEQAISVVQLAIRKGWETMLNGMRLTLAAFIEAAASKLELVTFGFAEETVAAMRTVAGAFQETAAGATSFEEELANLNETYASNRAELDFQKDHLQEQLLLLHDSKDAIKETADANRDLSTSGGPPPDMNNNLETGIKFTKQMTSALNSLRDELDPVGAAMRANEEKLKLLNQARAAGKIGIEEYAAAEKALIEAYQKEILEATGVTASIEKLNEARKEAQTLAAEGDVRVGFQAEIESINQLQATLRELGSVEDIALAEKLEENKELLEDQIRTFGDYAASVDPVLAAERQRAEELPKLNQLLADGVISQGAYNAKIQEFADAARDAALATGELSAEQQAFEGLKAGAEEYGKAATDVFSQVKAATIDAFKGAEDALVEFVQTGKLDFSSLVDSILADITRMSIRQGITGPLAQGLFGGSQPPAALGGGPPAPGGGFLGSFGSFLSPLLGGLMGGANGLDFNVGGAGGTDSQVVAFRSTPGARVVEIPPSAAGPAGGPGPGRTINVTMNLTGVRDERTFAKNQTQIVNRLQREIDQGGRNM